MHLELLYSLLIEPLLNVLRKHLSGLTVPGVPNSLSVKLTAYADDITVFVKNDRVVKAFSACLHKFEKGSSTRINWGKM